MLLGQQTFPVKLLEVVVCQTGDLALPSVKYYKNIVTEGDFYLTSKSLSPFNVSSHY